MSERSFHLVRETRNPILAADPAHDWEATAVMNPSVLLDGLRRHMLYRALGEHNIVRPSGKLYHTSSIGYAQSQDGLNFTRRAEPFLAPAPGDSAIGFEDPRITRLDGEDYLFYTSVSFGEGGDLRVQIAGARCHDFANVTKLGLVPFQEIWRFKAAALFPERIGGRLGFLYTAGANSPASTIYYLEADSIEDLFDPLELAVLDKTAILSPTAGAGRSPELGAVPLRTSEGWLLIYCPESYRKEWTIGAALLDLKDPRRVLAKSTTPLLVPQEDYELEGYVDNMAFPEGAIIEGDELSVYYGGGDRGVCLARGSLKELLSSLR